MDPTSRYHFRRLCIERLESRLPLNGHCPLFLDDFLTADPLRSGSVLLGPANVFLGDGAGFAVGGGGDVNGDGFDDVAIGAWRSMPQPNGMVPGKTYVAFGQSALPANALDLPELDGTNGFAFSGGTLEARSGWDVDIVGDVNGDQLADVLIGAPSAVFQDGLQPRQGGRAYLIFGRDTAYPPELSPSDLDGSWGVALNHVPQSSASSTGLSVSGAGDVNNDGFEDLLIGAPLRNVNEQSDGEAYVVFGHGDGWPAAIELADLDGTNGFTIEGSHQSDRTGTAVRQAGDVNGDGFDDVLVSSGHQTLVVFGKASGFSARVSAADLDGSNGLVIDSSAINQNANSVVNDGLSGAGDINNDGLDDILVVGSYLVFGRASGFPALLDVSTLDGSNGFEIASSLVQSSVASAGDFDNDGIDDLLIGSPQPGFGSAHILYGSSSPFAAVVDLDDLDGTNGVGIVAPSSPRDRLGQSVSGAGDFNGDGFDDVILGADAQRGGDPSDLLPGESWLVFGRATGDVDLPAAPLAEPSQEIHTNQFGDAVIDVHNASPNNRIDSYTYFSEPGGPVMVAAASAEMNMRLLYYADPAASPPVAPSSFAVSTAGNAATLSPSLQVRDDVLFAVQHCAHTSFENYQLDVNGADEASTEIPIDGEHQGALLNRQVESEFDYDFTHFTTTIAGSWQVEVVPRGNWDVTVNVFDAAGNPVAGSFVAPLDDASSAQSEIWTASLVESATYYVRVDGAGADQGDFDVVVQGPDLDGFPPAPFSFFRTLYLNHLGFAQAVEQSVTSPGLPDIFELYHDSGGPAAAQIPATDGDAVLGWFDGPGDADLLSGPDLSATEEATIAISEIGVQQRSWLAVREAGLDGQVTYDLQVQGESTASTSVDISMSHRGSVIDQPIDDEYDYDFYSFTADAPGDWQITVTPIGQFDVSLHVFAAEGEPLAGNFLEPINDGDVGQRERVAVATSPGGSRFIRVDGFGTEQGRYTLTIELLAAWNNPANRLDVDGDGLVAPADVLALVNRLNAVGAGPVPSLDSQTPPPFYDTTGDNFISPDDVLAVINFLNGAASPEGEGFTETVGGEYEEVPWWIGQTAELNRSDAYTGLPVARRVAPAARRAADRTPQFGNLASVDATAISRETATPHAALGPPVDSLAIDILAIDGVFGTLDEPIEFAQDEYRWQPAGRRTILSPAELQ